MQIDIRYLGNGDSYDSVNHPGMFSVRLAVLFRENPILIQSAVSSYRE